MRNRFKANGTSQQAIEEAACPRGDERYVLRLYIAGTTPRSMRAIANARSICEEHLKGRYDLEVIDLSKHRALAVGEQIIAAPTLLKKLPLPRRLFIGDLSDTGSILLGLNLRPAGPGNGDGNPTELPPRPE